MATAGGLFGGRKAEEPVAAGASANMSAKGSAKETGGRLKAPAPSVKQGNKASSAYRTISEVAADLDVATHVLRFWESKFALIQPLKKSGGRRYYRPEDIALLRHIQDLLYRQGYTIKGVQTHLNKAKKRDLKQVVGSLLTPAQVIGEVRAIHDLLRGDHVSEGHPQAKGV